MSEHLRANGIEKKGGVDEVLCGLREAGYQTAVVTATDEERTRSYLSEIGILDLFDDIVCATMVERGKPFPGCVRVCMQEDWKKTGRMCGGGGFAKRRSCGRRCRMPCHYGAGSHPAG